MTVVFVVGVGVGGGDSVCTVIMCSTRFKVEEEGP